MVNNVMSSQKTGKKIFFKAVFLLELLFKSILNVKKYIN